MSYARAAEGAERACCTPGPQKAQNGACRTPGPSKAIAGELGTARNPVRRYRRGASAGVQERPAGRRLSAEDQALAQRLFQSEAEGNAVEVQQLPAARGCVVDVRTVAAITVFLLVAVLSYSRRTL